MPMINGIGPSWSNATIAADEGWQVREGAVYLSTESSGDQDRGIRLEAGQAWSFPSGAQVYYRSVGGEARIAREVLA